MNTIIKRTGLTHREPTATDINITGTRLEKRDDGSYILAFTGTNDNGDRYCARILPTDIDMYLA